ncbi:hypothetical protein Dsin_014158 [Dipteronia sinensis]|uniref:Uncharacterized protein n=1 Tax=Dipteronia sinensis TaxID=43782 RepID=A0AAE0ALS9_9ROSI|nr:hypothetical protein Dsin_014158 [Dipteronia sinensis]
MEVCNQMLIPLCNQTTTVKVCSRMLIPCCNQKGVQPNVIPSLQPNHESGGVQPNVNLSLQPNYESEGVQLNVNPSFQQNNDSVPRAGSSEEPQLPQPKNAVSAGVQPINVNQEGSDHQQQLTEAQIAANYEIGSAEHLNYYRQLYLAAQRGEWETAKKFIELDPNALPATITTITKETVLHVAAFSWQWEFVLKLLEHTILIGFSCSRGNKKCNIATKKLCYSSDLVQEIILENYCTTG